MEVSSEVVDDVTSPVGFKINSILARRPCRLPSLWRFVEIVGDGSVVSKALVSFELSPVPGDVVLLFLRLLDLAGCRDVVLSRTRIM